jgi:hypothetical protein
MVKWKKVKRIWFRDKTESVPLSDACKALDEGGFKLPWREAGPPNYDDKVDSDQ